MSLPFLQAFGWPCGVSQDHNLSKDTTWWPRHQRIRNPDKFEDRIPSSHHRFEEFPSQSRNLHRIHQGSSVIPSESSKAFPQTTSLPSKFRFDVKISKPHQMSSSSSIEIVQRNQVRRIITYKNLDLRTPYAVQSSFQIRPKAPTKYIQNLDLRTSQEAAFKFDLRHWPNYVHFSTQTRQYVLDSTLFSTLHTDKYRKFLVSFDLSPAKDWTRCTTRYQFQLGGAGSGLFMSLFSMHLLYAE